MQEKQQGTVKLAYPVFWIYPLEHGCILKHVRDDHKSAQTVPQDVITACGWDDALALIGKQCVKKRLHGIMPQSNAFSSPDSATPDEDVL